MSDSSPITREELVGRRKGHIDFYERQAREIEMGTHSTPSIEDLRHDLDVIKIEASEWENDVSKRNDVDTPLGQSRMKFDLAKLRVRLAEAEGKLSYAEVCHQQALNNAEYFRDVKIQDHPQLDFS